MAAEDEFPPYGLVPDEVRQPLRPLRLERRPVGRPMLSQPVTSYKLLNRSTQRETPARAVGDKNKLSGPRIDFGPTRQRIAPPAVDEAIREIDEEESERLNPFDGYNPIPPRPRDGSGLKLRPRHDDINEYFTGPKWSDPRGIQRSPPYLDVAETRLMPPPVIVKKPRPKPKVIHRDLGDKVVRPRPPPPPPPPPKKIDKVFKAKNILFEGYSFFNWKFNSPAKFLGPNYIVDIIHVVAILTNNPEVKVRIKASVGNSGGLDPNKESTKEWIKVTMIKRGEAVANALKAWKIDPSRISIELGNVGNEDDDRNVEFIFDTSAP